MFNGIAILPPVNLWVLSWWGSPHTLSITDVSLVCWFHLKVFTALFLISEGTADIEIRGLPKGEIISKEGGFSTIRSIIPDSTMQIRKFIPNFQMQSTKESTEKNIRRRFRNTKMPEIGWNPFIKIERWQALKLLLYKKKNCNSR